MRRADPTSEQLRREREWPRDDAGQIIGVLPEPRLSATIVQGATIGHVRIRGPRGGRGRNIDKFVAPRKATRRPNKTGFRVGMQTCSACGVHGHTKASFSCPARRVA